MTQRTTSLWRTGAGRALTATVIALAVATLAGLVALWPSGGDARDAPVTVAGEVVGTSTAPCGAGTPQRCVTVVARVTEGPDAGTRTRLPLGPVELVPSLDTGDRLRLTKLDLPPDVPDTQPYALGSVDRRTPLLWLAIAVTAGAVLLVAWRGLLAVAGLALSLLLVTQFLLPAILDGSPALLVALVTAMAVTFVTVTLTSGIGVQTMAAILGIAATLALAAALAAVVAGGAHLDGRTSEVASALTQARAGLSLEGVVIAGVILGALGALTDTAVTQASAVMALRRSNPALAGRRLYREAFIIGRDHLSATIHTLVLAYTGATLPLLLAIEASGMRSADALSGQDLAEPIAATLIGALALLACVPLSTGLTVWLAGRLPATALPDAHAHAH